MAFLLVSFRTAGVLAVAGFTGVSLWATKDRGLRPKNGFGATAQCGTRSSFGVNEEQSPTPATVGCHQLSDKRQR
ncbi:MAG: hypothetical protein JOZ33_16315 [Acidobacteriaceae bacterium]|nr:hypothetical protein [Acidobacteriaceae bacterium]